MTEDIITVTVPNPHRKAAAGETISVRLQVEATNGASFVPIYAAFGTRRYGSQEADADKPDAIFAGVPYDAYCRMRVTDGAVAYEFRSIEISRHGPSSYKSIPASAKDAAIEAMLSAATTWVTQNPNSIAAAIERSRLDQLRYNWAYLFDNIARYPDQHAPIYGGNDWLNMAVKTTYCQLIAADGRYCHEPFRGTGSIAPTKWYNKGRVPHIGLCATHIDMLRDAFAGTESCTIEVIEG